MQYQSGKVVLVPDWVPDEICNGYYVITLSFGRLGTSKARENSVKSSTDTNLNVML